MEHLDSPSPALMVWVCSVVYRQAARHRLGKTPSNCMTKVESLIFTPRLVVIFLCAIKSALVPYTACRSNNNSKAKLAFCSSPPHQIHQIHQSHSIQPCNRFAPNPLLGVFIVRLSVLGVFRVCVGLLLQAAHPPLSNAATEITTGAIFGVRIRLSTATQGLAQTKVCARNISYLLFLLFFTFHFLFFSVTKPNITYMHVCMQ